VNQQPASHKATVEYIEIGSDDDNDNDNDNDIDNDNDNDYDMDADEAEDEDEDGQIEHYGVCDKKRSSLISSLWTQSSTKGCASHSKPDVLIY
jgi:hypothetical protein